MKEEYKILFEPMKIGKSKADRDSFPIRPGMPPFGQETHFRIDKETAPG